jgi:hypothetical protein
MYSESLLPGVRGSFKMNQCRLMIQHIEVDNYSFTAIITFFINIYREYLWQKQNPL